MNSRYLCTMYYMSINVQYRCDDFKLKNFSAFSLHTDEMIIYIYNEIALTGFKKYIYHILNIKMGTTFYFEKKCWGLL